MIQNDKNFEEVWWILGAGVIFLTIVVVGVLVSSKRSSKSERCHHRYQDINNPNVSIVHDQKNNVETSSEVNA